tara:strand:+ start:2631 stop:3125 length:495 start_codon:yes stop_codon:yes gene_type:complete
MTLKKKILVALILLFIIAQFFSPKKNQSGLYAINKFLVETKAPMEVQKILTQACFDCHSDQTTYPWYNSITPVNYWLNSHVNGGKSHLDVSKWSTYSVKRKAHKLEELIEEVGEGEMPLASYKWTHASADLTNDQIEALIHWAQREIFNYGLVKSIIINSSVED